MALSKWLKCLPTQSAEFTLFRSSDAEKSRYRVSDRVPDGSTQVHDAMLQVRATR